MKARLPTGRTVRWILGATLGLLIVPVLVDLLLSGRERVFDYMAADAFYYLTVARNIADHGMVSFDQAHLTNGFHPLWQLLLGALYWLGSLVGLLPHQLLHVVVIVGAVLIAGCVHLLGKTMRRTGHLTVLFATIPVGAYALIASSMWWSLGRSGLQAQRGAEGVLPLYGTLWSFINGMESAPLLFFFALAGYWYVSRPVYEKWWQGAVLGVFMALLVLSRLDHVFLVAPAMMAIGCRALLLRKRDAFVSSFAIGLAFVIPIVVYMLINHLAFSSAMPVSGKLKTTFPTVTRANLDSFKLLFAAMEDDRKWLFLGWRLAQMVVPSVVAALYLLGSVRVRAGLPWVGVRHPDDRFEHFMLATAAGVLMLSAYDFLFVPYGNQGHWYLPVSALFVSVALVRWLEGLGSTLQSSSRRLALSLVAIVAVSGFYFFVLHRSPDYHRRYADFYFEQAPRVREYYQGKKPRLLSVDDGIVAFATGLPTMSGTGLVGDAEMIEHAEARTTGNLAVSRGYDRFTSLVYYDLSGFRPGSSSASIGRWMARPYRLKSPQKYRFLVEYSDRQGRFAIVRVSPRTPSPAP